MSRPLGVIFLFVLIFSVVLSACDATSKVRERELRVSYVSIRILFEFVVKRDADARSVQVQKDVLIKQREKLITDIQSETDNTKKDSLESQLKKLAIRIKDFQRKEDRQKTRIYKIIDNSLARVAKRMGLDYILNRGDAVVFSRNEYDVTEDVIQEIIKLQKRNAPVSR